MFYYCRASPKHCNGTTEVQYGGRGHRTGLRTEHKGSTCVSLGCPPAPVYKGARGRPAGLERRAKGGGVLLPVGVGLPFPSPTRIGEGEGKERLRERERGAAPPPPPCPIRTPHGG